MAATDEREAGHTVQEREELTPRKRDPIEEQCLRDPNEGTARFQVIEADEKRGRSRSTRAPGAAVPWWGGKLGIGVGREAARWGIQREFLAMWCDINLLDAFGDVSGKAVVTMCVLQTRVLRKGEGKMLRLDGSDIICYSTYEYVEGYFDGNHADYDLNDEVADIYTEVQIHVVPLHLRTIKAIERILLRHCVVHIVDDDCLSSKWLDCVSCA